MPLEWLQSLNAWIDDVQKYELLEKVEINRFEERKKKKQSRVRYKFTNGTDYFLLFAT